MKAIPTPAMDELKARGIPVAQIKVPADPRNISDIEDPLIRQAAKEAFVQELHNLVVVNKCFAADKWMKRSAKPTAKTFGKCKADSAGNLSKIKYRTVVRGFMQVPDEHYDPRCLSTHQATLHTRYMMLRLAARMQANVEQVDVASAFLGQPMDRIFRIAVPYGMVTGGEHDCLTILRAVYGLKQSPFLWQNYFNSLLEAHGFERCKVDPCLYRMRTQTGMMFIAVFVDDLLIVHRSPEDYAKLLKYQHWV